MAKSEIVQALNEQIREELESSYIYWAMAADLESKNYLGAAAWFKRQSEEERGHATRLYNYVNDIGGKVVFQALPQPPETYAGLAEAFEKALKHEQHITSTIHALVRLARKHDDIATENFLQWFVSEQVEEEKTASEILAKIKMVGTSSGTLYMIDRDLGKIAQKESD